MKNYKTTRGFSIWIFMSVKFFIKIKNFYFIFVPPPPSKPHNYFEGVRRQPYRYWDFERLRVALSSLSIVMCYNLFAKPVHPLRSHFHAECTCNVPDCLLFSLAHICVHVLSTVTGCEMSYTICIQTNKMHKILVIRLYFPLDALHVSDCISPSSGATFISCTSHLVYGSIYKMRSTAYKSCSWWWTNVVRNM